MFKKILIFLLFCISSAHTEIIKELKVQGNDRISLETIKVYGNIEIGSDYTPEKINKILKDLYSTEFFESVNISLKDQLLFIEVKEYSFIYSVNLNGEPSNKFKELILESLKLKDKGSFIPSKLNDDVNLIKTIYATAGYNFANVSSSFENISNNRVIVTFNIDKGKKSYIKKINFIGDKKIKDSRLRSIIASEENKFWKFLSNNTYLNLNNIELDKRLLINYFKSLGYYDVQVLSDNSEVNQNNNIELTYTINAGQRYRIKKITTNVSNVIEKNLFLTLEKDYIKLLNDYYSPFKIKKLLDKLDILINNNDLQFVEHSVNEIIDNNNIEIIINVYEGSKQLVERIEIVGNSVTEESVIRSELLLDEGDPFNQLKLEKSIAKLKARNLFGLVKFDILDGTTKDLKNIKISVEEKPTGEITAGAGIGTSGGSFAFNISENNWLGKGISTSFFLEASSQTITGGLEVKNPNHNFSGNSLNYFLSNTKNDKPESGFKNNIISLGVGTVFEQYKDIYLNTGTSFSFDDLKVDDSASSSLKRQKGTFADLSFDYGLTSDKRDRVYGPTDGYLFSFNQTFPLYADAPFIKNSLSVSSYHSFTENLIGAFKVYLSAINGLNNEDVRLSKRLNLPSTKLRGFESGKIGPKDGSDYVGGNYVASTNMELSLPNLLPESTNTDIGLFLDIGNIWHVDYDNSINDSNKIRSSIGINTSWLSPVGPMSFIFSQNISKANTDITESFNFRLGTTF